MLKVGTAEDVIAEATDVMKVEGDLTLQPHTRRGSLAGGAASTEAEGLTVTCRVRSGEARSRGRLGRERIREVGNIRIRAGGGIRKQGERQGKRVTWIPEGKVRALHSRPKASVVSGRGPLNGQLSATGVPNGRGPGAEQ